MKTQWLLIVLTLVNLALLIFTLSQAPPAAAEGGPPVVVGNARQGGRGERQRRVAGGEQLDEGGGGRGHRPAPGFLVVSRGAGAGGRCSRWTPSAWPATITRSMRACLRAIVMLRPRE